MDFFKAFDISASGLTAQRTRVNVAASNLANAESTRGPDGTPYKRREPVVAAKSFDSELGAAALDKEPLGVEVTEVVEDQGPGRRVYSPGHPDADGDGFVTLPNVNPIHEVVNLMTASRSYEANATAIDTLKTMAQRALEITR